MKLRVSLILLLLQLIFTVNCAVNGTETPNPISEDSIDSPEVVKSKIEVLANVIDDSNTKEHYPNERKGRSEKIDVSGINGEAKIGFVRFDLSHFKITDEIVKAEIVVWVRDVKDVGKIDLSVVVGDWDESSLTYNLLDDLNLIPMKTFNFNKSHKDKEMRIDVTLLVHNWIKNNVQNNGIALSPHIFSGGAVDNVQVEFFSKENQSHPIFMEIELNR